MPKPWTPARDAAGGRRGDPRRLALGQHRPSSSAGTAARSRSPRPGRRGRAHLLRPQDDGTFLGTAGYHHGELLHVVRNEDGSVDHLLCETFVYTRVPYDPAAPVPGGHP